MDFEWGVSEEQKGQKGSDPGKKADGRPAVPPSRAQKPAPGEMVFDFADDSMNHMGVKLEAAYELPGRSAGDSGRTGDRGKPDGAHERIDRITTAVDRNDEASVDPYKLCELFLGQMMSILEAERGFILLYDHSIGEMEVYATSHVDPDSLLVSEPISYAILNTVSSEAKPTIISDALNDPRFVDRTSVVLSGLRSILCVPIVVKNGLMGIIYVDNRAKKDAFKEDQLTFLVECSRQIGDRIAKNFPSMKSRPLR